MSRGLKKATVKRLSLMYRGLRDYEERMQRVYGDASKGSARSSRKLDAAALLDVINHLHLLEAPTTSRAPARALEGGEA